MFEYNKILRYSYALHSGVQRSGDARGDCLIGCPPTKFYNSIEQRRMVGIVTGYTLFVT